MNKFFFRFNDFYLTMRIIKLCRSLIQVAPENQKHTIIKHAIQNNKEFVKNVHN